MLPALHSLLASSPSLPSSIPPSLSPPPSFPPSLPASLPLECPVSLHIRGRPPAPSTEPTHAGPPHGPTHAGPPQFMIVAIHIHNRIVHNSFIKGHSLRKACHTHVYGTSVPYKYYICVFVVGWRHAFQSEWPFAIIILCVAKGRYAFCWGGALR